MKGNIKRIILDVEVISYRIGIPSVDLYKSLVNRIRAKRLREVINKIILALERGKPKSKVYKEYLPKDLTEMLILAENKGYAIGEFFEVFSRMETDISWGKGKLMSAMLKPLVMFVIVSIISFFALSKIMNVAKQSQIGDVDTLNILRFSVLLSLLLIPLVLFIVFVKYPHKTPLLKRIYKEIEGFKMLSIINLMLRSGFSTSDIELFFKRIYPDKDIARQVGLRYLSSFLSKRLDDIEFTVLHVAILSSQYEKIIPQLLETKRSSFRDKIVGLAGGLEEVLILLSGIPVSLMIIGIVSFMLNVMNRL